LKSIDCIDLLSRLHSAHIYRAYSEIGKHEGGMKNVIFDQYLAYLRNDTRHLWPFHSYNGTLTKNTYTQATSNLSVFDTHAQANFFHESISIDLGLLCNKVAKIIATVILFH